MIFGFVWEEKTADYVFMSKASFVNFGNPPNILVNIYVIIIFDNNK